MFVYRSDHNSVSAYERSFFMYELFDCIFFFNNWQTFSFFRLVWGIGTLNLSV